MCFNYTLGNSLASDKLNKKISHRHLLIFGIFANLALLAYFKYCDFLIENINWLTGTSVQPLKLMLPLAISFFTFQQIAYLVDSFRRETEEYDFLNYCLFVSFFPQLIAGPIVHHKEMMPQFTHLRNKLPNWKNIYWGLFVFSMGLFKKVVIADTFSQWATAGYASVDVLNFFEA